MKVLLNDARYTESKVSTKRSAEVRVEVHGPSVILKDAESSSFMGSMSQESAAVIRNLLKYDVKVSGIAKPPKSLELLLYSHSSDAGAIGDYLSKSEWFLQQPDSYDRSTTYYNPQWLLRPGAEHVPSFQQESTASKKAPGMGAVEKSEIAELLDSATGPSRFHPARVSELLKTELKRFRIRPCRPWYYR